MKKLLLLFAVLLSTVSGWAQVSTLLSNAPSNGEWAEGTKWIQIKNQKNRVVRADVLTSEGYLALTDANVTNGDAGLWCIVANDTEGYKFYNRAIGPSKVLGMTGSEASAYAVFVDPNEDGYTKAFDIVASSESGYWCMKQPGTANNYWNQRDPRLAYWNSSSAQTGDDGSSFLFTEVELDNTGLATEAEITVAQGLITNAPGFPKTSTTQYQKLNVMVNSFGKRVVATELASAVTAYKTCPDIILPEDGKAYTFTFVMGGAADAERYYMKYEDGKKVTVSTSPSEASKFVCRELSTTNANEKKYAFITPDGHFLTWVGNNADEAYKLPGKTEAYGYSTHYAAVQDNLTDWNEITVVKNANSEDQFGYLKMTGRRGSGTRSSFIANEGNRFDQSDETSYFRADNSSACIFSEVVNYTNTDEQNAALAEIEATIEAIAHVDANASKLGTGIGYAHYVINETYNSNVTEIKSAICNAATEDEVIGIKNSYAFEIPQVGTEYVLYDVAHRVFVDIHNLAKEPNKDSYDQLARLNSEKQVLYVTATDNRWKIHTTAEGGNFLGQYTSDRQWNSKVNADQSNFSWLETPAISGNVILYTLQNTSGTRNGYLGNNGHANAGELYVDQAAEEMKLKLILHEAALVYKVVTTETTGAAVYVGKNYVNGDYIFANAALTNADLVARRVPGKECTDIAINEENKIVTLTYTIAANFKEGDKFFVKNREHVNDYIFADFSGGKLDNTEVPATKKINHTDSNIDYRFCWELKETDQEQCFYLYNPYYDWYAGSILGTTTNTLMSKTTQDAGKYKIETEGDYFVFHCLTSKIDAEGQDGNFLHWYSWWGGGLVGWQRSKEASQWLIEEVTDEMEAQWQNTLTSQYNTLTQHKIGTGVNQYSGMPENLVEGFNALSFPEEATAIEKARYCVYALYDYASAVEALVINQPTAGFYRIKSQNGNDANKAGKYWQVNEAGARMELVASKDEKRSIIYASEDYKLVNYGCGYYLNDYDDVSTAGTEGQAWGIVENAKVAGTYALDHPTENWFLSDWSGGATYGHNDANAAWTFEPVKELPFTFKKAALGFATFNAPVAVQLPAGVLAYITDMVEEENVLQMYRLEGNVVPANTAVMLYNEAAKADDAADETTIDLVIVDAYTGDEFDNFDGENDFVGTVAAKTYPTTGETVYSLQKKQKVQQTDPDMVGFYKKESGTDLGGFKAWIITTTSNARAFTIIFDGDDATGLKEALGLENENVEIYDLSGRRLDKPTKGINIVGGKLVIK